MPLPAGTRFGPFEIVSLIGRLHALADTQFEIEEALVESRSNATRDGRTPAGSGRRSFVVATVVIAALVAGAMWRFFPREGSAPARVMFLTSYPGVEATPTLAPGGKQVAFSWNGETDRASVKSRGSSAQRRA